VARFESEPEFLEQFAGLIPSAPLRQLFLEHGIQHRIARALELSRLIPQVHTGLHLDDGFGMLITEPGLIGIPALIVSFEYDPDGRSDVVILFRVVRSPELDETEDYSD
jgi:hypothetical protein